MEHVGIDCDALNHGLDTESGELRAQHFGLGLIAIGTRLQHVHAGAIDERGWRWLGFRVLFALGHYDFNFRQHVVEVVLHRWFLAARLRHAAVTACGWPWLRSRRFTGRRHFAKGALLPTIDACSHTQADAETHEKVSRQAHASTAAAGRALEVPADRRVHAGGPYIDSGAVAPRIARPLRSTHCTARSAWMRA